MNFFLDHDVPEPLAVFLARRGHVVLRLREVLPVEAEDAEVFAFARRERAIIMRVDYPCPAQDPAAGMRAVAGLAPIPFT